MKISLFEIGGVPSWVKTGGANIVILAFLDPIEL
jgi:hypothetical protein